MSISFEKKNKNTSGAFRKAPKEVKFGAKMEHEPSNIIRKTKEELKPIREALPIYMYRNSVMDAIRKNKNLILVGETGSGKTTQIPQYLLEDGFAKKGMIGCTQPRRVAAMTIADRVSQEYGCDLGYEVGYNVRFDDNSCADTKLKYLTDGMLLREMQSDPRLSKYSVIILDEAHERTLNTDILFGLLKRLQQSDRPDLRVIAMSATLDAQKFSTYFNAPVVIVPGRTHKVDIYFSDTPQDDVCEAAVVTTLQLHQDKPMDGDILIFLSGSDEIESVIETINDRAKTLPPECPGLICYPLYASLAPEQQLKAFEPPPHGFRKVVVSTNIGETSITVAGIKYVVDSGLAKVKNFHPNTGLETLQPLPISQAECFQRSGRSGREREGECYRLFTEEDFQELSPSLEPEILRASLSSVVLQLKALGVDDIMEFEFIDKPKDDAMRRAIKDLQLLQALDSDEKITSLGRMMNAFPIEPRYARVLIASAKPETAIFNVVKDFNKDSNITQDAADLDLLLSNASGSDKKKLLRKHKREEEERKMTMLREAADKLSKASYGTDIDGNPITTLPFNPCSDEMCTLIAALSADNLLANVARSNKHMTIKRATAHRLFTSADGDMVMYIKLLSSFQQVARDNRKKWCIDKFCNFRNMSMALDIRRQLVEILEEHQLPIISCRQAKEERELNRRGIDTTSVEVKRGDSLKNVVGEGSVVNSRLDNSFDDVKKCLITGLFDRVAIRQNDGKYVSESKNVAVHPSSIIGDYIREVDAIRRLKATGEGGVKKTNTHASASNRTTTLNKRFLDENTGNDDEHPYQAILFHSLVYTTRNYIRDVMAVKEDWLYDVHPLYFKDKPKKKIIKDDEINKDSHTNTLFKGQRTAFSNLKAKGMSATASTAMGNANLPKSTTVPNLILSQGTSVKVGKKENTPKKRKTGGLIINEETFTPSFMMDRKNKQR